MVEGNVGEAVSSAATKEEDAKKKAKEAGEAHAIQPTNLMRYLTDLVKFYPGPLSSREGTPYHPHPLPSRKGELITLTPDPHALTPTPF